MALNIYICLKICISYEEIHNDKKTITTSQLKKSLSLQS